MYTGQSLHFKDTLFEQWNVHTVLGLPLLPMRLQSRLRRDHLCSKLHYMNPLWLDSLEDKLRNNVYLYFSTVLRYILLNWFFPLVFSSTAIEM